MAKQIKSIQCPQCGSIQQSLIKEDHYKCESCGAEYFLDNDDINVNVRYEYAEQNTPPANSNKTLKITFIALTIFFIFILLLFGIFSSEEQTNIGSKYHQRIEGITLPRQSDKAIAFYVASLNDYSDRANNQSLAAFFNLENRKIIKEIPLNKLSSKPYSHDGYASRYFAGLNKYYLILHKTKVFEIDYKSFDLKEVTQEIIDKHQSLDVGIATIEFAPQRRGDGFQILSNTGENISYYPYDSQNTSPFKSDYVSFEDIMSESVYFNTEELYQDGNTILIRFNPTPAPDAPTSVQLIDIASRKPIWTKQIDENKALLYQKGVCKTNTHYIVNSDMQSGKMYFVPLGKDKKIEISKNAFEIKKK